MVLLDKVSTTIKINHGLIRRLIHNLDLQNNASIILCDVLKRKMRYVKEIINVLRLKWGINLITKNGDFDWCTRNMSLKQNKNSTGP